LKSIFTRMGIVSGQTLVNYLGTFWDRSFGVRFLHEGYLSALNYATTLFELPNLVYNKSIGTTTYINQLKYSQDSKSKFEDYSRKIFKLTAVTAMVGQLLFVVLAPAFIIILYRRGKFDNDSVAGTLVILEILAMGLAPTVLLLFGSRMLYALQSFKQVFGAVFFRILIKISLITTLISVVPNILPISTTLTAYFAFIYVFVVVARITGIRFLSPGFLLAFAALLLLNLLAVFLNSHYFEYYLDAPIALIVIFAALVALLGGLGLWIFASKSGFLAILKKN
ncbi:MAG TPA: lipid II flippase MurJ, partial [Calditrichia bacterium]|nr:lipid II flippase MurJ [Calditrichia bacterium]